MKILLGEARSANGAFRNEVSTIPTFSENGEDFALQLTRRDQLQRDGFADGVARVGSFELAAGLGEVIDDRRFRQRERRRHLRGGSSRGHPGEALALVLGQGRRRSSQRRSRIFGVRSVLDCARDSPVGVARYQLTFGKGVCNLSLRLDPADAFHETDRAVVTEGSVHRVSDARDESESTRRGKVVRIMRNPVMPQHRSGFLHRAVMHGVGRGDAMFRAILKPARGTVVQSDFAVPAADLGITAAKNEVSKADPLDDHLQGFPEVGK